MITTVKEFAKKNEVHYGVAMGVIMMLEKLGKAKDVGSMPHPEKHRGKRARVYVIEENATLNFADASVTGWVPTPAKKIEEAPVTQPAAVVAQAVVETTPVVNAEAPVTAEAPTVETAPIAVNLETQAPTDQPAQEIAKTDAEIEAEIANLN